MLQEGSCSPSCAYLCSQVVLSAQTLIKIVSHAKSGGNIEVMGLLQGRIRGDTFLLSDCFRLPVEGTETRVNAGESANEFMVEFTELNEMTEFSKDMVCGWYHSHPGYGCWLSGIDVETQLLYQSHQDPFVAIVIDPFKTASAGRVEIGAFRTYPRNYSPPASRGSTISGLSPERVRDYGVHCHRYYQLEVEIYKSPLDQRVIDKVWGSYWADILSTNNFEEAARRLASELEIASDQCFRDQERSFSSFAEKVSKCSCRYISEIITIVLNNRMLTTPLQTRNSTE